MEEDSQLFKISAAPEVDVGVPIYNVDLVYDINSKSDSEDEEKNKRLKISKNTCWNCNKDDHSLRDCKLPHDARKISQNRSKFLTRGEFRRYHVDVKKKIYPHLTPGVISDKLRAALGINKNQLPPFIYKMRSLGYPPGWLLYAKTESSGIEMFDTDGKRIPNADEEEGEIQFTGDHISYDESKIITFPGFNAWPEPGYKNETRKYGAPEMNYHQSREEFIRSLKTTNVSVCNMRSVKPTSTEGECDMDIEETGDVKLLPDDNKCSFIPPLPDETDGPLPPPPPGSEDEGELRNGKEGLDETTILSNSVGEEIEEEQSSVNSLNISIDTPGTTHGKIKSIDYGTPTLKIHSPYSKLPPPEAFKKDISDVINFENLPDSTGAYEKLKGVLKYARTKMTFLKENKLNNTF